MADEEVTPPLGERVPARLSLVEPAPMEGTPPTPGEAPPTPDEEPQAAEAEDATSAVPMTPEMMAELGYHDEPEEGGGLETQIMNITDELLADLRGGGNAARKEEVPEDPIYREVYTRFVTLKKMCGDVSDLTFDEFKRDLERSQAEVMAEHGCKRVRFHVVIQGGKAVLRTTPVAESAS
jgi:hypothetical protein